jgi:hypothetical protein
MFQKECPVPVGCISSSLRATSSLAYHSILALVITFCHLSVLVNMAPQEKEAGANPRKLETQPGINSKRKTGACAQLVALALGGRDTRATANPPGLPRKEATRKPPNPSSNSTVSLTSLSRPNRKMCKKGAQRLTLTEKGNVEKSLR